MGTTCVSSKASKSHEGGGATKEDLAKLNAPAPFDEDDRATRELDDCDYEKRISYEMAERGEAPRKVRIYADGIYDLFHGGHARQLMQCKNAFPKSSVYLMVGVNGDAITREKKGETVLTEQERYEAVRHCRYVDEVVRDPPWVIDDEFLERKKIDFVAHDAEPYTMGEAQDVYAGVKEKGMFVRTERTVGISTTDIITRILKRQDVYLKRNLDRGLRKTQLMPPKMINMLDKAKKALRESHEEDKILDVLKDGRATGEPGKKVVETKKAEVKAASGARKAEVKVEKTLIPQTKAGKG